MSQSREERLARNESRFRSLNESLEQNVFATRPDPDAELAGFVCECGDADCTAVVRIDLEHYERVRQDARDFLVRPGHEIADVEDVVERQEAYLVVRKHQDAREIVEETNPRG